MVGLFDVTLYSVSLDQGISLSEDQNFSTEYPIPMQMECVDFLPSELMGTLWYAIKA